jgi:hypothetical protein
MIFDELGSFNKYIRFNKSIVTKYYRFIVITLNLCRADSFSVGLVNQARKYLTSSWFVTYISFYVYK